MDEWWLYFACTVGGIIVYAILTIAFHAMFVARGWLANNSERGLAAVFWVAIPLIWLCLGISFVFEKMHGFLVRLMSPKPKATKLPKASIWTRKQ